MSPGPALAGDAGDFLDQAALSHTCFPGHERDLRFPGGGVPEQGTQPVQLRATTDENGADQLTVHAGTVRCVEPIDHPTIGHG
jgi:hypothetical protein